MRILIATPLYPPDIAPLAVYVKELATRLSAEFDITILAYAHTPEKIDDVRIVAVKKNTVLPFRLFAFTRALWKEARNADLVFIQNGASVELPGIIVSLLVRTPFIVHFGDTTAIASAQKRRRFKTTAELIQRRSTHCIFGMESAMVSAFPQKTTVVPLPHTRPEILPFAAYPTEAVKAYESSWTQYITTLCTLFKTLVH